jgi:hypothetical protein
VCVCVCVCVFVCVGGWVGGFAGRDIFSRVLDSVDQESENHPLVGSQQVSCLLVAPCGVLLAV